MKEPTEATETEADPSDEGRRSADGGNGDGDEVEAGPFDERPESSPQGDDRALEKRGRRNSAVSQSVSLRAWSRARTGLHTVSESAATVGFLRFFLRANAPDEQRDHPGTNHTRGETATQPGETEPPRLLRGSRLFHTTTRGREIVGSSVIYRVLVGKPEPREVVIDLRKPQVVATLRNISSWLRQTILGLSVTSSVAGVGYRAWNRFSQYPIRMASIGLFVLTLLILIGQSASGGAIGPSTLILAGLMLVAVRGMQKTQSLGELADTRWVK